MHHDYKPFLNTAVAAAREASRILLQNVDRIDRLHIRQKDAGELVSNVDEQVDGLLIEKISSAYPEHAILTEESGFHGCADAEYRWVIDPIDGTTNYIMGIGQFCISIALLHHNNPVIAVVYQPITDELFTAMINCGSRLNGVRIRSNKPGQHVTDIAALSPGSRLHAGAIELPSSLSEHYPNGLRVRIIGSAALSIVYQACARFRLFYGANLKIWDIAAAALIAQEAGSIVKIKKSASVANLIDKIAVLHSQSPNIEL